MIRYNIKSIPHDQQQYDTMGDWYRTADGTMQIRVDNMGDWRKELIVAIHEMVEAALCEHRGISESVVSEFDKSHPNSPQPGDEPDAPYRLEHEFATDIERLIGRQLGVDLQSY